MLFRSRAYIEAYPMAGMGGSGRPMGKYGPGSGAPPVACRLCGEKGTHYRSACPFTSQNYSHGSPIGTISYDRILEDCRSKPNPMARLEEIMKRMRETGIYTPKWNPDKTMDWNKVPYDTAYMYLSYHLTP